MAAMILAHTGEGVSIVLWDRRNSGGKSGVCFDDELSLRHYEMEVQATDLFVLLSKVKLLPCALFGNSSGARLQLLFAALFPDAVRGLICLNISAGPRAAEVLSGTYYGQHVSHISRRGKRGILECKFYSKMAAQNPDTAKQLEAAEEGLILDYMKRNKEYLAAQGDAEAFPALGVTRSQIESTLHSTLVLHNYGEGDCDGVHALAASERVAKLMRNAALVASTDSNVWFPALMAFVERLRVQKRIDDEEAGICSPRLTLDEDLDEE
jgi:pimeloyl-ACP methyl ester carboxylesterase